MKKLAAFALALALLFTTAAAETYTAGGYYTVDYPDTLTLDDTTYQSDSTDTSTWLFMLLGDDYLIDASMSVVDEYAGFSLTDATDAEKQAYLAEVLASFADQSPALVGTVTAGSGVPFYLFSMEDSDGEYYYAETILDGNSVNFCCYYYDATVVPDTMLLSNLKTVLSTYTPVESAVSAL